MRGRMGKGLCHELRNLRDGIQRRLPMAQMTAMGLAWASKDAARRLRYPLLRNRPRPIAGTGTYAVSQCAGGYGDLPPVLYPEFLHNLVELEGGARQEGGMGPGRYSTNVLRDHGSAHEGYLFGLA
jgi:hypothetical protein